MEGLALSHAIKAPATWWQKLLPKERVRFVFLDEKINVRVRHRKPKLEVLADRQLSAAQLLAKRPFELEYRPAWLPLRFDTKLHYPSQFVWNIAGESPLHHPYFPVAREVFIERWERHSRIDRNPRNEIDRVDSDLNMRSAILVDQSRLFGLEVRNSQSTFGQARPHAGVIEMTIYFYAAINTRNVSSLVLHLRANVK
jgi:hypothetical protein